MRQHQVLDQPPPADDRGAMGRAIGPIELRAGLAQGVDEQKPIAWRTAEVGLRREQPADRQADIDRAARCCILQEGDRVLDDAIGRDHLRAAERAVLLAAEVPHQGAMPRLSEGRADLSLPGAGIAGQRVEEDEGRPACTAGAMMLVEERIPIATDCQYRHVVLQRRALVQRSNRLFRFSPSAAALPRL